MKEQLQRIAKSADGRIDPSNDEIIRLRADVAQLAHHIIVLYGLKINP